MLIVVIERPNQQKSIVECDTVEYEEGKINIYGIADKFLASSKLINKLVIDGVDKVDVDAGEMAANRVRVLSQYGALINDFIL